MPKITILNTDQVLEASENQTILEVCEANNIHVDHACGGVCACSTCHVWIEEGLDSISEPSEKEEDRIEKAKGVKLNSRLACQARLGNKDISVRLPPQKGLH